jgi:hypothetical protein
VRGIGIMEVAIMTGLWIRTVIILSYMAFSPFDPQICPKSNKDKRVGKNQPFCSI